MEIARIAATQHGVVTTAQLSAAHVSPAGVTRRVAAGRLHRIHRGVYAVGHRSLSERGRWMAAVLAYGEGAVLSHLSAAELWGIRRRSTAGERGATKVEVTVPRDSGRAKRTGITLHRSATLSPDQCTWASGIPVTTPARTLDDLRSIVPATQLARAIREAEFLGLEIGDRFESDAPRTELETRMLWLCRRHRLPRPEVNSRVDRYEVDFLWRDARLIVEVDGWASHGSRSAFEEDRERDTQLAVLGYVVVRFTWRQVTRSPSTVAGTVRTLLSER
jgi:very-short-patch-repair endonuclease